MIFRAIQGVLGDRLGGDGDICDEEEGADSDEAMAAVELHAAL